MKRWFKALTPYMGSILIIIGLLIVEAFCELKIPDYTSNIIDTGIQNSGVEYATPSKITAEDFDRTCAVMTNEQKEEFKAAYTQSGDIYVRKSMSEDEIKKLDADLSAAYIISAMAGTSVGFSSGQTPVSMDEIEEKIDSVGGDSIKQNLAISFARGAEERAGVDLNALQQDYIMNQGIRMLVVTGIMAAAIVILSFISSRVGAAVGRDLREQTYEKVMTFSNAEMEKFSTSSLITRTTNDVLQIQQVTVMLLRFVLYAPVLAIGGVINVAANAAGIWWTVALAIVAILGVIFILISVAVPKFKKVQKLIDNVNRISREFLTGIPVIRAFGREKVESKRLDGASKNLYKTQVFIGRTMSVMMPVLQFIMFATTVCIVLVSSKRIDAGNMQVGQLTAFLTYSMLIITSFLIMTMLSIILPRAQFAANRIDEVLKCEPSIEDPDTAEASTAPINGLVEFKNVSFKYPGAEEYVLKDITFTAEPGKTLAIIGATGCGKTTLLQLIPRLYDVTEGGIYVDGTDIKNIPLEHLRGAIGYVPQQRVLFSGTIKDNIAYGNKEATMDEIMNAAGIAQAAGFIEEKDEGYDSYISQGGSNVSGGQNQRLQIARALAMHPKIMLFDDSFSALDMKTDKLLRDELKKKIKGTTFILVAQRVGTIMDADEIIVLDEGRVVGKGSHKDLLANCETYIEIAQSQLSEEELYGKEGD